MPASLRPSICARLGRLSAILALLAAMPIAGALSAYVRVSQVGYEAGEAPFRAYLMSASPVAGNVRFQVMNSKGDAAYVGHVGAQLGTWSHNKTVTYYVYPINFSVPADGIYEISVSSPAAKSPPFAVESPDNLYSGLLLNTLFFYQTQRDGANFIPNALPNPLT